MTDFLPKSAVAAASRLIDLVFPRDCACCGEPAGEIMRWFCDACARAMPLTAGRPCCTSCGLPFEGAICVERVCPDCADLQPKWQRGCTLLRYEGPAEDLVKRIKFCGERCLLGGVTELLRARPDALDLLRGAIVVPVPLYPGRERGRGFNQSEWLAQVFADEAGASCQNLLRRVRDTGTQTALSREERQKNVKGAFALAKGARIGAEQKYVLVDDVITTGATLNACAVALAKAGATQLAVLTLSHA
ncbi:MAG: ComF family protein [Opitutales bacterium]